MRVESAGKDDMQTQLEIGEILRIMVDRGGSDLHLKVPTPPVLRIDGELIPQEDQSPLNPEDIEAVFMQISTPEQRAIFKETRELDFAYSIPGLARFRVNALRQRGSLSLAFRIVPFKPPSIDELGLPPICKELILKQRGLILVTGSTGSGKSTTLAAMINHLNENNRRTVITIEDPIEFVYQDQRALISQRELGDDTLSFAQALKHALRHDTDVLVIGELRDMDTISTALLAAETGHLVLGTLHTIDTAKTADRIIDMFPHEHHRQVRIQLAQVIEAVLCQTLLPRIGGGRVAAFEIMLANSTIRKLIQEEKTAEIPANMEISTQDGMQTMNQALAFLVKKGLVQLEDALSRSSNRSQLQKFLQDY
jgi:twitching motility protein PilT